VLVLVLLLLLGRVVVLVLLVTWRQQLPPHAPRCSQAAAERHARYTGRCPCCCGGCCNNNGCALLLLLLLQLLLLLLLLVVVVLAMCRHARHAAAARVRAACPAARRRCHRCGPQHDLLQRVMATNEST
jgi:hypothetical protein